MQYSYSSNLILWTSSWVRMFSLRKNSRTLSRMVGALGTSNLVSSSVSYTRCNPRISWEKSNTYEMSCSMGTYSSQNSLFQKGFNHLDLRLVSIHAKDDASVHKLVTKEGLVQLHNTTQTLERLITPIHSTIPRPNRERASIPLGLVSSRSWTPRRSWDFQYPKSSPF